MADLPAGYRFGNYVILERIGRGGMAQVYRAEHVALSKHVALKVMDHALHDQAAAHRQFLREGRAAAAVKHPNVVDITDVGVWQGVPFLVMELLEGWDLETHLRERGPLPDGEIVRLALPIIAGLATAHDAGVTHRDLKPSNIFLARGADGDQVPKVLDFGISKLAREAPDLTATPYGTLMGTPLYLPPEALGGAQAFSAASDQYSLGVVLYECAVGRPPFQQDTLVSLLQQISAGDFIPPSKSRPDLSAVIDRAIVRAMHPDPRQRFRHVRDLGRALWDVASPRTQVVWGRAFGDSASPVSQHPGATRSSTVALRTSSDSAPQFASTRQEFVSPSRRLSQARGKLAWLLAAALLVLGGAGLTAWFRDASGPHGEPMSNLAQPREAETSARALQPPSPGPSVAPAAQPAAATPGVTPSAAAELGLRRSQEVPAGSAASRAVQVSRSTPVPRPQQRDPSVRSRAGGAATASPVRPATRAATPPRVLAGEPLPAASDQEFPGLRTLAPEAGASRASAPRGANESPILD